MEVKSTLTRTSMGPGGATSTSSSDSGTPGPHATAAARAAQVKYACRTEPRAPPSKRPTRKTGNAEEKPQAGNSTFACDGLPAATGAATAARRAAVAVERRCHGVVLLILPWCLFLFLGKEIGFLALMRWRATQGSRLSNYLCC